jgi:hypothetical protein
MLKILTILSICSFVIAGICLLLTIILSIVYQNKLKNKLKNTISPDTDNIDLWAKFPGKLISHLNNYFSLYNYTLENNKIINATPTEPIYISESINYSDFNFNKSNFIKFKTERTHKIEQNNLKNKIINTIDMGNIESIETLANPPEYQIGLNSLSYLFGIMFPDYLYFAKDLFTINIYKNFSSEKDVVEYLEDTANIDEETAIKMYEDDYYGFKNIKGFYQYILILNDTNAIESAEWLNYFNLTEEQKYKLLGNESNLTSSLLNFLNDLKDIIFKENLENISYIQLLNQSLTQSFNIENMEQLYLDLNLTYPFIDTPEMNYYFENYFKKIFAPKGNYDDYKLNIDNMKQLFDKKSNISLYSPKNTALLLLYNKTKNYKSNEFSNLTDKQALFLTEYLFSYLPSIILYEEFELEKNGEKYKINQLSLTFTNLISSWVHQTYYSFINNNGIYNFVKGLLVTKRFKENITDEEAKDYCMETWQEILDDGKRVLKICNHPRLQFTTPSGLTFWGSGYDCVNKLSEECSFIEFLRTIIYITDEELQNFYSDEKFGQFVKGLDETIEKAYNCKGHCNNQELAYIQWVSQNVTLHPPEEIKENATDTISNWFPDLYPIPIEFGYYSNKSGCSEENCNSISINNTILLGNHSDNLKITNEKSFYISTIFKKMHTLYLNGNQQNEFTKIFGIENSKEFFKVFDYYTDNEIFGNLFKIYNNPVDILTGYSSEDSKGMQYLSKGGNYYDNFKPNISKITGFNIYNSKINNNDNLLFDYYTITTNADKKSMELRKIVEINNISLLNILTKEYDFTQNDFIDISAGIFNNFNFQDIILNDGFQFSSDKKKIYYYDEFSSRLFQFDRKGNDKYNSISCKKYEMNTNINMNIQEKSDIEFNLDNKKVLISNKFKKPMIVSTTDADLNYTEKIKSNNFICVNTDSNFVIKSEFNLIYSIYSKKYQTLNSELENNVFYPLILYKRTYEVEKQSYKKIFDFIQHYRKKKKLTLILGLTGLFLFLIAGILLIIFKIKLNKEDDNNSITKPLLRTTLDSQNDDVKVNEVQD